MRRSVLTNRSKMKLTRKMLKRSAINWSTLLAVGKVKSVPYVPGSVWAPNSAPDRLTPNQCGGAAGAAGAACLLQMGVAKIVVLKVRLLKKRVGNNMMPNEGSVQSGESDKRSKHYKEGWTFLYIERLVVAVVLAPTSRR